MMLVRHWSIVQIGEVKSQKFEHWRFAQGVSGELAWAVIVPTIGRLSSNFAVADRTCRSRCAIHRYVKDALRPTSMMRSTQN